MSTNINNSAYSTLNTYAVLAASGITTVNTTTITNGVLAESYLNGNNRHVFENSTKIHRKVDFKKLCCKLPKK